MPVKIVRSTEEKAPTLVLCIYSQGGVGKTTLATTAPKPIFIDSERGTKALGARGIDVPIIHIKTWNDVLDAWNLVKNDKTFETVVLDPIGAFLDVLIENEKGGGEMNLRKWGQVKERIRKFIWTVKDGGKHVVFVSHEKEEKDDEQVLRRPLLNVNMWQELVNICDVVGHLRVDQNGKRSLRVQPEPKYYAKDRFSALGNLIENPSITDMIAKIHQAYNDQPFPPKEKEENKEDAQKIKIVSLLKSLGWTPKTPDEFMAAVKQEVDMELKPENYVDVIDRLSLRVDERKQQKV